MMPRQKVSGRELLLCLGYSVECHPDVPNGLKHPDFLACSPRGDDFYLEAVLANEASDEKVAEKARMNVVYDTIDRIESPNFFVGMRLSLFFAL